MFFGTTWFGTRQVATRELRTARVLREQPVYMHGKYTVCVCMHARACVRVELCMDAKNKGRGRARHAANATRTLLASSASVAMGTDS